MSETELLILGAGPAGMARAFWERRRAPRRQIHILERSSNPGGWARSLEVNGHHLELGPQALRPDDTLLATLRELGLEKRVVEPSDRASRRFVVRDGRLRALPSGPAGLLTTGLMSFRGKLRALREPRVPRLEESTSEESVTEFIQRRFGREAARLASAMVHGIFAGDADRLEARSAFPVLAEFEREHGSVLKGMKHKARARRESKAERGPALLTFEGGIQALTDRLHKRLGDVVSLGVDPVRISRERDRFRIDLSSGPHWTTGALVLATPAWAAADLLRPLDEELGHALDEIPFVDVVSAYVSVPAEKLDSRAEGFGCLFEKGEPGPVLGILYASSVFPDHAPRGRALYRVMIGGARDPEILRWDEDRVEQAAVDALRGYLKLEGPFEVLHIERCARAIPQYERGHAARLSRIKQRLRERHPGLELCGNSYEHIALPPQLHRLDDPD
ncbi:MAG: protoporphyrinogen oxidase [Planctomycetota bacterium]